MNLCRSRNTTIIKKGNAQLQHLISSLLLRNTCSFLPLRLMPPGTARLCAGVGTGAGCPLVRTLSSIPPPIAFAKTPQGRDAAVSAAATKSTRNAQISLRKKIQAIFISRACGININNAAASRFIKSEVTHLDKRNLVQLFMLLGRSSYRVTREEIIPFVSAMTNFNKNRTEIFSYSDLGKILCCLHRFDMLCPHSLLLVKTLCCSVRALESSMTAAAGDCPPPITSRGVSSLFFGLQVISSEHAEVRELVGALDSLLRRFRVEDPWRGISIGNMFLGFRTMTSSSTEVLALLQTLTGMVEASPTRLEGLHAANVLHGLKEMDSKHAEVRRLLGALSLKMGGGVSDGGAESTSWTMSPKELSMCLHGLMLKSSRHAEVRALLGPLTSIAAALPAYSFNSTAIGVSLFGLRNMDNQHGEVGALLKEYCRLIAVSDSEGVCGFTHPTDMSNAFYGLQNFSGDDEDVLRLVSVLSTMLKSTSADLEMTGAQLSAALYGLKGMPSFSAKVRELLRVLTRRVSLSQRLQLSTSHFSMMVFGLQSMSSAQEEVRGLLRTLLAHVEGQERGRLLADHSRRYGQFAGTTLYGLHEMSCEHAEVRAMLARVLREIEVGPHDTRASAAATFNAQEISYALYGLQNMSSGRSEVLDVVALLTEALRARRLGGAGGADEFLSQGKGMCVYGVQQLSLEHSEVRDLLAELIWMLGNNNIKNESSNGNSYRATHFLHKLPGDQHVLCGLMLSLYGVASLQYNAVHRSEDGSAKDMSKLFALLREGGTISSGGQESVLSASTRGDLDVTPRNDDLIYDVLRAVRGSFAEEEHAAFRSLSEFSPDITMKSVLNMMLNLRRNANMMLYFFPEPSEGAASTCEEREDMVSWLRQLCAKCEVVLDDLTRDQHMIGIQSFNNGEVALSIPFEFKNEKKGISNCLRVLAGTAGAASALHKLSPQQIHDVLNFDPYITAEGLSFNLILKALLAESDVKEARSAGLELHAAAMTSVCTNELGNVCYISNSSKHVYDVCLTHNEILFGVDTDMVLRLYARGEEGAGDGLLPASFSRPPLRTFNIEVDGPSHSNPTKQSFTRLRDAFLGSQPSQSRAGSPCVPSAVPICPGSGSDIEMIRLVLGSDQQQHGSEDELFRLILGDDAQKR